MSGRRPDLVMAVFPNSRGFGYAVFEGMLPVDWGVSDVPGVNRNEACTRRIMRLLEKYKPDVLLLRDALEARGRRVSDLIEAIAVMPSVAGSICLQVSRAQIREAFGYLGRPTRQAIANAIADRIPFFEPLVPPKRKIWNSEDRRMGLFDAVALALTYLDDGFSAFASAA
jgi:hypothetical protein